MNAKEILGKTWAGVKWPFIKLYNAVKWIVIKIKNSILWIATKIKNFILWDIKQVNSLIKGTWNLIVKIYKWIESILAKMGRFWIGISFMTYGVLEAAQEEQAFVSFLNGTLEAKMANGDFAIGLGMIFIGLVCVVASADWSEITTFKK